MDVGYAFCPYSSLSVQPQKRTVSADGNVEQHSSQGASLGVIASGVRVKLPAELKPIIDATSHHESQGTHLGFCCCRLRERLLLRQQELSDLLALLNFHQQQQAACPLAKCCWTWP